MKYIVTTLFAFIIFFQCTSLVSAISSPKFDQGKSTVLTKGEIVNGSYFAAGEKVELSGVVNGDAHIVGGEVVINGTINGDLLVMGGQITLNGTVTNDARIIGGQVIISGTVKHNLTIAAGSVEITPSANLGGDLVVGTGNLSLNTPLPGNLVAGAGNINVAAPISGDVRVGTGQLSILSTGSVKGKVDYWSDKDISLSPSATISGTVTKHITQTINDFDKQVTKERIEKGMKQAHTSFIMIGFISSLLVGWILIKIAPYLTENVANTLQQNAGWSILIGLGVVFLVPLTSFLLLITLIGAPLSFILMTGFGLLIYFSKFVISLWLGKILSKQFNLKTTPVFSFLLGLIIYYILVNIPVIDIFVRIFGLLFGMGAIVITIKAMYTKARSTQSI